MLKYQNAFDKHDNVVHISRVDNVNRHASGPFHCLGCNAELIPALGNIREHHFKHKSNSQCNFETYLHKAAKFAVYSGLKKALEENEEYWVFITQSVKCPKNYQKGACGNCGKRQSKLNLAKEIDSVSIEKKAKGFIADVLVEDTDTDVQIAIEICVTNPCSIDKIASGLSIIETKVSNEADVQQLYRGIPNGSIDYNVPNISDISANHCLLLQDETKQKSEISFKRTLILYDDGRLFIRNQPFTRQFRDEITGRYFDYCTQSSASGHKFTRKVVGAWGVDKAFIDEQMAKNVVLNVGKEQIKSCLICRHFTKVGPNVLENITCSRLGAKPQFESLQCDLFDPN